VPGRLEATGSKRARGDELEPDELFIEMRRVLGHQRPNQERRRFERLVGASAETSLHPATPDLVRGQPCEVRPAGHRPPDGVDTGAELGDDAAAGQCVDTVVADHGERRLPDELEAADVVDEPGHAHFLRRSRRVRRSSSTGRGVGAHAVPPTPVPPAPLWNAVIPHHDSSITGCGTQ